MWHPRFPEELISFRNQGTEPTIWYWEYHHGTWFLTSTRWDVWYLPKISKLKLHWKSSLMEVYTVYIYSQRNPKLFVLLECFILWWFPRFTQFFQQNRPHSIRVFTFQDGKSFKRHAHANCFDFFKIEFHHHNDQGLVMRLLKLDESPPSYFVFWHQKSLFETFSKDWFPHQTAAVKDSCGSHMLIYRSYLEYTACWNYTSYNIMYWKMQIWLHIPISKFPNSQNHCFAKLWNSPFCTRNSSSTRKLSINQTIQCIPPTRPLLLFTVSFLHPPVQLSPVATLVIRPLNWLMHKCCHSKTPTKVPSARLGVLENFDECGMKHSDQRKRCDIMKKVWHDA